MPAIMVPKATAEKPLVSGGGNSIHPEGVWNGRLERATGPQALPFTPKDGTGYTTPADIEVIRLQFGGSKSLEGDGETNQKIFVDLVTRDGDVAISDQKLPGTSWQLQRSQTVASKLAQIFGATEEVEFEGETYVATAEDFIERLGGGEFNDTAIGYEVYHGKEYTVKRGTPDEAKRRDALVKDFFTAV